MKLLLGTKNRGKLRELFALGLGEELPIPIELLTVDDVPFSDVPETGKTFLENALLKARAISEETGLPVLAEDSGLEVEALGGAPGVRSARFAGEGATDEQNLQKLLKLLEGVPEEERRARFVCVAVLRFPGPDGREIVAEGELLGRIAPAPRGEHGFGYDPVFLPEGFNQTLGELGPSVKDRISHRRRAVEALKRTLRELLSPASG